MSELLKRQLSLTVLKVRLGDASCVAACAAHASNERLAEVADPRVHCELQITGNAAERELLEPGSNAELAPSRRKASARRTLASPVSEQASQSRTVAHWMLHPHELQLPLTYLKAARFNDSPAMGGWLGDRARGLVTSVLKDWRVDVLERFAAAKQWLPNGRPTLPLAMGRQLQSLLHTTLPERDCLWLELAEPLGYLPALPWETMLKPYVDAPVLRLSPHVLKPLAGERELSVALCISLPFAGTECSSELLTNLIGKVCASLPEHSTLHVFPDSNARKACADSKHLAGHDANGRIVAIHDARQGNKSGSDEQPWTSWITRTLAGRAIDIIHFCAQAFMYPDQARMAVARVPAHQEGSERNAMPVHYITSSEICRFMTQLGTWGSVFSLPKIANIHQSRAALRLFADQVARQYPGIVTFHDLSTDAEHKALGDAYQFMAGHRETQPSRHSNTTVYCNPASAMQRSLAAIALPAGLRERYEHIQASIQATLQRERSLPAWMAAMQRAVELAISRVASAQLNGGSEAALRGVSSALEYVEKVFKERASKAHSDVSTMQQGLGNATE